MKYFESDDEIIAFDKVASVSKLIKGVYVYPQGGNYKIELKGEAAARFMKEFKHYLDSHSSVSPKQYPPL
jgi:hypothetical protein